MMTNGGMETENNKANTLNKLLDIDLIKESDVVMCHTPLGEPEFI